jgi:hypothetical protein
VKQLKKDYSRQVGNKSERPACILFEQWKALGRSRIMQERLRTANADDAESKGESKGESKAADAAAAAGLPSEANDKIQRVGLDVLTLPLFQVRTVIKDTEENRH